MGGSANLLPQGQDPLIPGQAPAPRANPVIQEQSNAGELDPQFSKLLQAMSGQSPTQMLEKIQNQ